MSGESGTYRPLPMDAVEFGAGCVERLPRHLERLGRQRALILTGNTLANRTPLIRRIEAVLGARHAGTFSGCRAHVPRGAVVAAAAAARECGADVLVSVGGSTPCVVAKGAALMLAEGITTRDDLDRYRVIVEDGKVVRAPRLTGTPPPVLSVSTTLSAGEYTEGGGITDEVTRHKQQYRDPALRPRVVFLDPEMTLHTPPQLWTSTGIKAVDHAAEMLYSLPGHPFADATALHATRLLFRYLPASAAEPENLSYRVQCQQGAFLSIAATGNGGTSLSHAIGHYLGSWFDVPHGITSCITLPHVMEFVLDAAMGPLARFAEAAGATEPGMSEQERARAAIAAVRGLVRRFDLPSRLLDVGVDREELPRVAEAIMHDRGVSSSPRPVTSAEVLGLLGQMY